MDIAKARVRGEWVLIKEETVDKTESGIGVPQSSAEGKRFVVLAFGSQVKDLNVGDITLLTGKEMQDWARVPRTTNLIIAKQYPCVVLVLGNVNEDKKAEQ